MSLKQANHIPNNYVRRPGVLYVVQRWNNVYVTW